MDKPLGWWTRAVESVPMQTAVEGRARESDDFTKHGAIVVVANALSFAAEPLYQAQCLLPTLLPGQHSALLNGHLYITTLILQSVLDGIASTAQKLVPLPDPQGNIYFKDYSFVLSDVAFIGPIQSQILGLRFSNRTFFQFADALKHEHAWVGSVSRNRDQVQDVYNEDVGYLYGVLIPIYKYATTILCRLAKTFDQPVPAFNKL